MHRNFIKQSVLCSNLKCNFMEAEVLQSNFILKLYLLLNPLIPGELGVHGERAADADILLPVPGDAVPGAVLVVLLGAGPLPPSHHLHHPLLGQHRHNRPLDPAAALVQQDSARLDKSYKRSTKATW